MQGLGAMVEQVNNAVNGFVWGPWMLCAFLGAGVWLTAGNGWFQFTWLRLWWHKTAGQLFKRQTPAPGQGITARQSAATALASTIGTGNIAGVATAIAIGGPGAVFWMWVSALFGMMTAYAENVLGMLYRYKDGAGRWVGGAYLYIERGLGQKWLGKCFAFCCVLASFGMGNMTQANSVACAVTAMAEKLVAGDALPRGTVKGIAMAAGVALVLLVAPILFGGLQRVAGVAEKLVPFMAGIYLLAGFTVLAANFTRLPGVLGSILQGAFTFKAAVGGAGGYLLADALKYGIARGVFSNEAGLGSAVAVHAAAEVEEPVEQGMWGIFEVFVDTILVCSVTAFAILSTGVFDPVKTHSFIAKGSQLPAAMTGVGLTEAAFSAVLGEAGGYFICIAILLFAFATLVGWSCFGEQALTYLLGSERYSGLYKMVYLVVILVGSSTGPVAVWEVADTFNGLMALPNLPAVVFLSPKVFRETRRYLNLQKIKK